MVSLLIILYIFVVVCRCSKQPLWSATYLLFWVLQHFTRRPRFARRILYLAESSGKWTQTQVITSLLHLSLL